MELTSEAGGVSTGHDMANDVKVLIPLYGNDVAPRFDLATEVWILVIGEGGSVLGERTVVLPRSSAEELCNLILREGIHTVICGGIEEEYYQYLTWKRVQVFDSVIGSCEQAIKRFGEGLLQSGDILFSQVE